MSKKDLIERLSSDGTTRRSSGEPPGRDEAGVTTKRVSRRVVRRRRRGKKEDDKAQSARRRSADVDAPVVRSDDDVDESYEAEDEVVEAAEVESAPEPVAEPEVAEPVVEAAPEPEASVEAAEAAPAEPPPAEAAPAEVVEAAPVEAEAPAAEATPEPAAAEAEQPKAPEGARLPGLGAAVIAPPPGYDPTNPDAYRRVVDRQQAAQQAGDASPAAPRRRRLAEPGGGGPAGRGRGRGPAGPGGAAGPRGRRTAAQSRWDAFRKANRRGRKRKGPSTPSPTPKAQKRKVKVDNVISVKQLAHEMGLKAGVVIKHLMELGTMVRVNDMLDIDTAQVVANEFEYEVENVGFREELVLEDEVDAEEDEGAEPRPPVVTIMGHVDHGKTTLLDAIRDARVASGEAGGITQHIGAYQVEHEGEPITFVDTPGHAAFTAMRARGANLTDIVVLVVAADDGVQPQTREAINHAKAAEVPIIVAINKCDKAGVNPDHVKNQLAEFELIPEEWGGDTLFAHVSALKREGLDTLLEQINLQAEFLELRANPDRRAVGTVIEAKMERGRGPVATVLVQEGTLKQGEHIVIGSVYGKVRNMMDYRGKSQKKAGPSMPVEVFGLSGLPETGDTLTAVKNEKDARTLAEHRAQAKRDEELSKQRQNTLEDLLAAANKAEVESLSLILKADVQGSLEALKGAIEQIDIDGAEVRIIHSGVGNITESDVTLAATDDLLLIGFNVKVDAKARQAADGQGVEPQLYTVIYAALDAIRARMLGMLEPEYEKVWAGTAEVRAIFDISRIGRIAGSYVTDGLVSRNHTAVVKRDGEQLWEGKVSTLKRFKDDVREVRKDYECGIGLEGFNEIEVGDIIETYGLQEVQRT